MNPTVSAFVRSWPWDPWLVTGLLLMAAIYLRGWRSLRRRDPVRWTYWHLASFLGAMTALFLALASPIEPFASLLLQVHMLQHLLLMMVVPPLVWLGAPFMPLLRGLPRVIRQDSLGPVLKSQKLRSFLSNITHPLIALLLLTAATWLWHLPGIYDAALRWPWLHYLQHVSFLLAAIVFWYPVIRPYPARPKWFPWLLLPCLLLADIQNTVLSAILSFSEQPLYSHYASAPRISGISVLDDQATAGVLMWVPGSVAYLGPLFWIGIRLFDGSFERKKRVPRYAQKLPWHFAPLSPQNDDPLLRDVKRGEGPGVRGEREGNRDQGIVVRKIQRDESACSLIHGPSPRPSPPSQPTLRTTAFAGERGKTDSSGTCAEQQRQVLLPILTDARPTSLNLLKVPVIGPCLSWRHARLSVQVVMFLLAAVMIYDGLTGPQIGAMNLAGVLPWIHWRGLLILALLVAGNFFCFACPFTLPRKLAQFLLPQGRIWPRWLQGKWLAVGLLGLFLWAYEAYSLWDHPALTAWIAITYFIGAFLIDVVFRKGTFCKYVCPIGQFNFVQSMISPLEVRIITSDICASCTTHECIRGSETSSGCDMQLFQPRKQGNMDCTFCLDCVQACPQENVGLLAKVPGAELWDDGWRSGIGKISERVDLAALVLLLTFGAFANAAGMVGPVLAWQDDWSGRLGIRTHLPATSLFYFLTIIVLPIVLVSIAASFNRRGNLLGPTRRELATRFAFAFVPLGFAMWLVHYSFHFFTSSETIIPVMQRFTHDLGWRVLGTPLWSCACCRPFTDWLIQFELLSLDLGLLASLYAAWKIAGTLSTVDQSPWKIFAPWGAILIFLFILGVWIVFQPMQMRGTLPGGG